MRANRDERMDAHITAACRRVTVSLKLHVFFVVACALLTLFSIHHS